MNTDDTSKFNIFLDVKEVPTEEGSLIILLVKTDIPKEYKVPTLEYEVDDAFIEALVSDWQITPLVSCVSVDPETGLNTGTIYEVENDIVAGYLANWFEENGFIDDDPKKPHLKIVS
jgi:hypothetical protein